MRRVYAVPVLLLGAAAGVLVGGSPDTRKPAGELPEVKELPNPFTFADGSPVRTRKDWERRRLELKELFQDYVYGHMPPRPQKMTVKKGERVTDEENKVTIQDLEVLLEHDGKRLTINLRVILPSDAKGKVPVVIQSTFGPGFGKGPPSGKYFTAFTSRGYAVALFSFNQVAADNRDRARSSGLYRLFGDKIDCGALMAWAWGVSRVIDALETVPEIDTTRVVVTGHSRYGKAALVAGAFDERIALTVPSHSGCAGVAPFRFIFGKSEQLHNIVGAFPHWFRPDFKQFAGKVDRLPVDQHLLLALVAPRALLDTEGTKDSWTNPEGAQLTHRAARKVYDFLKAGDNISIRYRPVGHIPSTEDLLAYADHVFFRKALPRDFGALPYRERTEGFTWDMPK
jgi:endo-1,4-beta-xylanase